jgi:hypothetical protein
MQNSENYPDGDDTTPNARTRFENARRDERLHCPSIGAMPTWREDHELVGAETLDARRDHWSE